MKIIIPIILCLLSVGAFSQITGLEVEVVYVDDGTYGGFPENAVTYRVYITMTNEDDFLSSIYAVNAGDCPSVDSSSVLITTTTNFFQHELAGGWLGENQGCIFFDIPGFETGLYDSYITTGQECQGSPGCDTWQAFICPNDPEIWELFEGPTNGDYYDGDTLFWDDGAIFSLQPNPCSVAGEDLRVLAAQLTTDGAISGHFTARAYINGNGVETDDAYLTFAMVSGCTDETACNYMPDAEYDNNSCDYSCFGCTDEFACNFDPDATLDDNSCEYGSAENDNIEAAIELENLILTDCQTYNHCLNSDSPEWPDHLDSWFRFSANFETANLTVSSIYNDLQIALLDSDFELVLELDETTEGAETLTLSGLIPNATYYLGIASSEQSGVIEICSEAVAFEGDLNGDGVINIDDLLDLLEQLGCEPFCEGDLDGDGLVTILDLLILLGALGGP